MRSVSPACSSSDCSVVRREAITRELVDRAIDLYMREAYGAAAQGRGRSGGQARRGAAKSEENGEAASDPFRDFLDETLLRHARDSRWDQASGGHERHHLERYALRLGNQQYPYMKLILQEHIVPGEFYFTVDTHDQLEIRPDMPDYEQFMQVKRFNFKLKRRIEESWEGAGIPTLASIAPLVGPEFAGTPAPVHRRGLILVVDDEENEAKIIEKVLEGQGFDVVLAGDGREALDRLRQLRARPILIVLDYEMPEMDGITMIRELRRHEDTRSLRVLLTTASEVISDERSAADGFLPKPFHHRDFIELVDEMVDSEAGQ